MAAPPDPAEVSPVQRAAARLAAARDEYWERTAAAQETAHEVRRIGREAGDDALQTRALALLGAVALHRGDLRRAFALAAEAEHHAERRDDDHHARAELSALRAQLSFFSGAYADALRQADLAVDRADQSRDSALAVFTRRQACVVLGNLQIRDWPQRLFALLDLTVRTGSRWQEAISRNDLAHLRMVEGDLEAAAAAIEHGFTIARGLAPDNRFALGVLHCTRSEIDLAAGNAGAALVDAETAIEALTRSDDPNTYLLGMTVVVEVRALLALGRLDDAQRAGEAALAQLGDQLPHARSLILTSLATALRAAGHTEAAYDALERSAELERRSLRELSDLQMGLERAALEAAAARHEADLLRDQAERDWLTGLHNRRFLAQELDRVEREVGRRPFSVAMLDLDHFKAINDRHGHETGDRVLKRLAQLLVAALRAADHVVRVGGEEFVVLMGDTAAGDAVAACERVCAAVRAEDWDAIAPGLTVTVSVGVATAVGPAAVGRLTELADRRLYEAKRAGRDRVVAAAPSEVAAD